MTCELQGLRVHNINVRGRHSQDNTVGFGNIFRDEVSSLLFDICRLITDGDLQKSSQFPHHISPESSKYLRQTWEIHQCQTEDVRRVDFEVYWLPVDTLVISGNSRSLVLDFPFDILEFRESSIRYVVEFCPFWLCC